VDMGIEPFQDIGTAYLGEPAGIGDGDKPSRFSLSVSPSPFNSECQIEIMGIGHCIVEIYNVLGQSVAKLYDGISNGRVSVKWNPGSESAGVFFVKATNGISANTQRIYYLP